MSGFDCLNGQKNMQIRGAGAFHFRGVHRTWRRPRKLKPFKEKYLKFRYARDFIEDLEIPKPGESIYAIVSGSFIFGDIMLPLAKAIGGNVEMDICTLSMGQENIDMIDQMFEEDLLKSVRIILSDYFYSHERGRGGLWCYLMEILGKWPEKSTVSIARVHTKIVTMRSKSHSLVLSGSANLRSSGNMEQFDLKNDKNFYDWQKQWMDQIHEKFAVKGKSPGRLNVARLFG